MKPKELEEAEAAAAAAQVRCSSCVLEVLWLEQAGLAGKLLAWTMP